MEIKQFKEALDLLVREYPNAMVAIAVANEKDKEPKVLFVHPAFGLTVLVTENIPPLIVVSGFHDLILPINAAKHLDRTKEFRPNHSQQTTQN